MPNKKLGFLGAINTYLRRNRIGEILVSRGKLTPQQLKTALEIQKSRNEPLGRILTRDGFISSFDLRFALMAQTSLRLAAAIFAIAGGASMFSPRDAFAGGLREIPNSITLAFSNVSAGTMSGAIVRGGSLFGTGERSSADLSSFTKWSAMFDRFADEVNSGQSNEVVQKWRSHLASLKGLPLDEMADGVNDMMNDVRYIGDNKNWGRSDYWETPVEFLSYGGDCEDFAIAKYVSLRMLGVPDNLMRVAIVRDVQKGLPHAILIVYTDEGPMVLDNQIKRMTPAADIGHYKPIYSINRTAWWLHSDRNSNVTQVASAAR